MSTATARVSCRWCGAPSGLPGVRLRKATLLEGNRYVQDVLCDACHAEFDRFGRRLSFWDWLALFLVQLGREAAWVCSARQHARQLRLQWRFRARGVPVRAHLAERAAAKPIGEAVKGHG